MGVPALTEKESVRENEGVWEWVRWEDRKRKRKGNE